jgi:hypothetical protein
MSRRARRHGRPSAGQPACPVKSPTASRGASIGENCDPEEEEGIFGAMTTPARMTVGWSYATSKPARESSPGSLSPASSPSGSTEQDTPSALPE